MGTDKLAFEVEGCGGATGSHVTVSDVSHVTGSDHVVAYTQGNTERGSSDLWSHLVAMLLLLRKKGGKNPGMRRTYFPSWPLPDRASSGQGPFRSHDFVTFGQKAPLERIWRNFRFRMRRTYFRRQRPIFSMVTGTSHTRLILSMITGTKHPRPICSYWN
jgi:hypothetical protein